MNLMQCDNVEILVNKTLNILNKNEIAFVCSNEPNYTINKLITILL